MYPFSITVFATTGDPEGIRHVDKSNWSGCGVIFTRELSRGLREPGIDQAGIYLLVGNAAEETIYIGEADPVGDRLRTHASNKDVWVWGVYFVDRSHKIGKTEVQYLEAALVALAKKHDRAILLNKNNPNEPTMAPMARASAQAFLADMLLILPMLGINAFTPRKQSDPTKVMQQVCPENEGFDTIVVPAREEGFRQRFLGENCWFAVRIDARHIAKLKFIAAYQVAPVAAITHLAEIDVIVPYNETGKYMLKFKGTPTGIAPIPRLKDSEVNMQSARYALRDKLLSAKNLDEIWK
jgi:hypothetical protein